jgi:hypothetical protein
MDRVRDRLYPSRRTTTREIDTRFFRPPERVGLANNSTGLGPFAPPACGRCRLRVGGVAKGFHEEAHPLLCCRLKRSADPVQAHRGPGEEPKGRKLRASPRGRPRHSGEKCGEGNSRELAHAAPAHPNANRAAATRPRSRTTVQDRDRSPVPRPGPDAEPLRPARDPRRLDTHVAGREGRRPSPLPATLRKPGPQLLRTEGRFDLEVGWLHVRTSRRALRHTQRYAIDSAEAAFHSSNAAVRNHSCFVYHS